MPDKDKDHPVDVATDTHKDAPAGPATPRTPNTPQTEQPALSCPTCGGPLERYAGANPYKVDTGFCRTCGLRHRLEP